MKPRAKASALLLLASACLCLPLAALAQQKKPWTWKDRHGNIRIRADLDEILAKHKRWVESNHKAGERADLNGEDLSGARLDGANLNGASLKGADLRDANLWNTDLCNSSLGWFLYMNPGDGRVVWLPTKLAGAKFEPKSLPEVLEIAEAKGLELMTYFDRPSPLMRLRNRFREAGYREQERAVTYVLNRHKANPAELLRYIAARLVAPEKPSPVSSGPIGPSVNTLGSFIEGTFKWIAFDLTCQYGFSPGRCASSSGCGCCFR